MLDDLAAEHAALDAVVAPLDDVTWERPTPATGWTIVDCVAHLRHDDFRRSPARPPTAGSHSPDLMG